MPVASTSPSQSALASPAVREAGEPRIVNYLYADPSAELRASSPFFTQIAQQ